MVQQISSVLNESQRESLEIENFIFHIIDPDAGVENNVIPLDEVELNEKQKIFFIERLKDIAEGTQYVFNENSIDLKEKCISLINEPSEFIQLSKRIATDFASRHKVQMAAGVFVVAIVKYLKSAHNWKKLIFLVKMDKQPSFSYSYREVNGKRIAYIEEIQNSLNETKSAIQKSALIDTSEQFEWHVLAFDRIQKPGLSDYFRSFLGVTERLHDSVLTRIAFQAVKQWAHAIPRDDLPENEDANTYIARAINYLQDHEVFDTESFMDTIVKDGNAERKNNLTSSLKNKLDESGVSGQIFKPQSNSILKKDKKLGYITAEGVTISYEGSKEAAGIEIQEIPGGRAIITIKTNNLTMKS